jgi:hypothetical protein
MLIRVARQYSLLGACQRLGENSSYNFINLFVGYLTKLSQ